MSHSTQARAAGAKGKPAGKPKAPASPKSRPRTGKDFGEEGTNKTIPVPKPDGAPAEELGNSTAPHIEKTPYIRG